jgi:hypothetical protein
MRQRIFLTLILLLLAGCRAQGDRFEVTALYEPITPHFQQFSVIASGLRPAGDSLASRADIQAVFVSNEGLQLTILLATENGALLLASPVDGAPFQTGDTVDAGALRQMLAAQGIVSEGRFKAGEAEEMIGIMLAAAAGPEGSLPEGSRYTLIHSSARYLDWDD